MKKRIFNNWLLKLASVVCAMMLWFVVYNSEDPVEYGRFYNVQVTFENTEVLEKEGKVYQVLDNSDVIDSVSVRANRSVINDLSKDDIHVVADFNNYKMDGTIELEFSSERHSAGEIEFNASSDVLKLFVENKAEASPYIHVETIGEPADGYLVYSANTTQNRINVSGGASVVERISKAVAIVDVSDAMGDINTSIDLVLYDKEGSEISVENLEMSMKTVATSVVIYPTKTVPVRYEISGEPAEDFVVTGEVAYGVTEVEIMGRSSYLAKLPELVISGEEMSIEGSAENAVLHIDLDDYLPTGVYRVNRANNDGKTSVTVEIVPIIEQKFTLLAKQVSVMNVPDDHFADRVLDTAEFEVIIRGAQHLLRELDGTKLQGSIDFEAWMAENDYKELGEGKVYLITPGFDLGEEYEVISVEAIEIVAGKKEE